MCSLLHGQGTQLLQFRSPRGLVLILLFSLVLLLFSPQNHQGVWVHHGMAWVLPSALGGVGSCAQCQCPAPATSHVLSTDLFLSLGVGGPV